MKSFSENISTGSPGPYSHSGAVDSMGERKSSFSILKKNRIPLTSEERAIVISRKAVWHYGPRGEKTPAVWKSKDSHGNIVYITNTHRAWNKASTLLGAISRYHNFIKMTAEEPNEPF